LIVLDASAAVAAIERLSSYPELISRLSAEQMHAPTLIDYEVWHAVRGLTLSGKLTEARARASLADFGDLPIERWPADELLQRRAFELRHDISAYDASFVALAEVIRCPLITRDERPARATGHNAVIEVL
jgi:predicted nucleic acid-binding protein